MRPKGAAPTGPFDDEPNLENKKKDFTRRDPRGVAFHQKLHTMKADQLQTQWQTAADAKLDQKRHRTVIAARMDSAIRLPAIRNETKLVPCTNARRKDNRERRVLPEPCRRANLFPSSSHSLSVILFNWCAVNALVNICFLGHFLLAAELP